MKTCPNCKRRIADYNLLCPHCGAVVAVPPKEYTPGDNEFRSKLQFFGIPLVHIVRGPEPGTGRIPWAKGVIAIGPMAVGGVALGNIAYGGIAFGSLACGLVSVGAVAAGIFAVGGLGVGVLFAVGGLAVSMQAAIGGLAIAPHAIDGSHFDPETFAIFKHMLAWFTH